MGLLWNVMIVMRLKEEDKKRRVRMRKKESRLGRGKRANEEYRRMYTRTKEKRLENKRKK